VFGVVWLDLVWGSAV